MKIIQAEIYKCDHCGKVQFRKCDMGKHEKWCKKNPANMHICFAYCVHLKKEKEPYDGDEYEGSRTTFTCTKLNKKMYSFKAERRGIVKHIPGTERMPLECDSYLDRDKNWEIGNEGFGDY